MWLSIASTFLAGVLAAGSPAGPTSASWVPPLASGFGKVLQGFQRPPDRFAAGHRGVDLRADQGTPVLAIGDGAVWHVGEVA
ncbi:MAG: hypothetical protein ACO3YU_03750 [Candidatus Nanopelagicales bacterium]